MNKVTLFLGLFSILLISCSADSGSSDSMRSSNQPASGQSGSMARFTINGNHLYTLSKNSVLTYNIDQSDNPLQIDSTHIAWNTTIETIFTKDTLMFFGATDGLYIYELNNYKPFYLSQYRHIVACDPVVADNRYAYVTLRTGNACTRGQNLLEVIDLKDIRTPKLVKSYPMSNPKGLGLSSGNKLYVCDNALKAYSISFLNNGNVVDLNLVKQYELSGAYDIIPVWGTNRLIVTATDGIYQFEFENGDFKLLSKIPVL